MTKAATILLVLLLAACMGDKQFLISGTLVSTKGDAPQECWLAFQTDSQMHAHLLPRATFDEGYAVSAIPKAVAIICSGYKPVVKPVPDGGALGRVVLEVQDGA